MSVQKTFNDLINVKLFITSGMCDDLSHFGDVHIGDSR